MRPKLLHRLWSWVSPITYEKRQTDKHALLYVKLFQNQWILTTPLAIYSYGSTYRPYVKMFQEIKTAIPKLNTILVLGTGLGSALAILQKKYQCYPDADLVDYDEEILELSNRYMNLNSQGNVYWHASDAVQFVSETTTSYDLIVFDIFQDMKTPDHVLTTSVLENCKRRLQPNGILCMNTIPSAPEEDEVLSTKLNALFTSITRIPSAQNVFYICQGSIYE